MWKCKQCGEVLEETFETCWQCGTEDDGTSPRLAAHEMASPTPLVESGGPAHAALLPGQKIERGLLWGCIGTLLVFVIFCSGLPVSGNIIGNLLIPHLPFWMVTVGAGGAFAFWVILLGLLPLYGLLFGIGWAVGSPWPVARVLVISHLLVMAAVLCLQEKVGRILGG